MGKDYPNDSITENGQNTEKSHSNSSEKPSTNIDVKNSKGVNNDNNNNKTLFFLCNSHMEST